MNSTDPYTPPATDLINKASNTKPESKKHLVFALLTILTLPWIARELNYYLPVVPYVDYDLISNLTLGLFLSTPIVSSVVYSIPYGTIKSKIIRFIAWLLLSSVLMFLYIALMIEFRFL